MNGHFYQIKVSMIKFNPIINHLIGKDLKFQILILSYNEIVLNFTVWKDNTKGYREKDDQVNYDHNCLSVINTYSLCLIC